MPKRSSLHTRERILVQNKEALPGMQKKIRNEVLLPTKYLLEPSEESTFQIAGMFDDMRGAFEYEADQWISEIEPFFTVPEIILLFQ